MVVDAIEVAMQGVQHEIYVTPKTSEMGYKGVAEASNMLIDKCVGEGWDYLWIVEGDVQVPEHAFRKLCVNADINLGIYPYHFRGELRMMAGYFERMPPGNPPKIVRVEDKATLEDRVFSNMVCSGVGCALIARHVFEKAPDLRFVHDVERFRSAVGGHDQLFLWEAQRLGFKVFLHGDVVCGHLPEWELSTIA